MSLRCLRRSKAEPQTGPSSHIASHNATIWTRRNLDIA